VTASGAERPKKPHYLPAQPYLALNRAVGSVNRGLDSLGTFLVGSCLERADFRDVDVRTMMTDEAYDRLFPGGESGTDSDAFWSLALREHRGLPGAGDGATDRLPDPADDGGQCNAPRP
jgi:hypothetical protein